MYSYGMSKNDDDHQLTIDSGIKNMNRMSSELNKLIVKSQMLLCDLILTFSQPVQDVSRETEEKNQEDLKMKDATSIYCPSLSVSHS
ncbi:putative uncharacterized protein C5orf58 homolog [Sceloporus undulatus]|uniref:putative uncharacterized protein C5orf58 homolog n=1 Tax=Sceloporus undulatus TaxID=8520 RepID=UPI001C4D4878|nr:putative uncharacterized protein C5orf58 homolog [Sceloporus undulatus]